jgi:hypothetical protein
MRLRWVPVVVVLGLVPCAAWPQGNPLGPEFRVNTYTTNLQLEAHVGADASGNFVVVWTSYGQEAVSTDVFGQRYTAGGGAAGPEFRVNTYTASGQYAPSVSADTSGNFVVVWASYYQDDSDFGIFGQRYAAKGAPLGPEFRVNTYTTNRQAVPDVAADASGNFVVVWTSVLQDDPFFGGVFGQRYSASGVPLGSEFHVNTYTTNGQGGPHVAADPSGNFVVLWSSDTQDGSGPGVFGQRYAASGAPLGPEFRVNTYTTNGQGGPQVAADGSGNFVVVWTSKSQDGSDYGVFGQRYAASGVPLGPEFRVNTYTTNVQWTPAISADTSGNFVVVWNSITQDGSSYGVFGQRFAANGAPLGPEFRVNTYTTNGQSAPDVGADASGNFVVLWTSDGQDGSSFGVFGQRYGPIVPVELLHVRVE